MLVTSPVGLCLWEAQIVAMLAASQSALTPNTGEKAENTSVTQSSHFNLNMNLKDFLLTVVLDGNISIETKAEHLFISTVS